MLCVTIINNYITVHYSVHYPIHTILVPTVTPPTKHKGYSIHCTRLHNDLYKLNKIIFKAYIPQDRTAQ